MKKPIKELLDYQCEVMKDYPEGADVEGIAVMKMLNDLAQALEQEQKKRKDLEMENRVHKRMLIFIMDNAKTGDTQIVNEKMEVIGIENKTLSELYQQTNNSKQPPQVEECEHPSIFVEGSKCKACGKDQPSSSEEATIGGIKFTAVCDDVKVGDVNISPNPTHRKDYKL